MAYATLTDVKKIIDRLCFNMHKQQSEDEAWRKQEQAQVMVPGMKQGIEVPSLGRPDHGSAVAVRFGDPRIIWNIDPLFIDTDAVMAIFRFLNPDRKQQSHRHPNSTGLAGPNLGLSGECA